MNVSIFQKLFNDKHYYDLKKLKYKYPNDFDDFVSVLNDYYYKSLPLLDFNGHNIVFVESKAVIHNNGYRFLMLNQGKVYGEQAIQKEIISTAKIESIDYSRDSVRSILKGFAPKDYEETRILGMKKGFDFIADKRNVINEENIYKLYMMTVGDFLDSENRLSKGNYYRHDSVQIQDLSGKVSHIGMNYSILSSNMTNLISFINADDDMNELVKAAVIHFYIAYIHPYFDGNGRMARMIHLWYLVQQGFDNTLFVPFSGYIVKSVKKYYDAYSQIEENQKYTGVIDVTPFVDFFINEVYDAFEKKEINMNVFDSYKSALNNGEITLKEEELWKFIVASYGASAFSTKQLEKDFGNVAYATVRAFVIKFEKLGLLSSQHYSNRVKYRIKN